MNNCYYNLNLGIFWLSNKIIKQSRNNTRILIWVVLTKWRWINWECFFSVCFSLGICSIIAFLMTIMILYPTCIFKLLPLFNFNSLRDALEEILKLMVLNLTLRGAHNLLKKFFRFENNLATFFFDDIFVTVIKIVLLLITGLCDSNSVNNNIMFKSFESKSIPTIFCNLPIRVVYFFKSFKIRVFFHFFFRVPHPISFKFVDHNVL